MKNLFLAVISIVFIGCNSQAQKSETTSQNFEVNKTETQWKEILSPQEFNILRKAGTERAFTSELLNVKEPGTFVCAACGNKIYETKHKFESGTGWPSFDRAIEGGVDHGSDRKLGYQRNEVHCARCGGHLGHVFNDGPRETTGKRHCINGVAMNFVPTNK